MDTGGNAIESPNNANAPQNPMSLDQYDLNSSDYPLGLQLSSSCPYHDADILQAPVNSSVSPKDHQRPCLCTPLLPNPNPCQNRLQSSDSIVGEAAQKRILESKLLQEEHQFHPLKTSVAGVDQAEGNDDSEGSSEVQFVCEIRRSDHIKRTQGSTYKDSLTQLVTYYPTDRGTPSGDSNDESLQPSTCKKRLSAKSKSADDLASIRNASKLSDVPHQSSTEKKRAASKRKERKISKRRSKEPKSSKKTRSPTGSRTAGQKKGNKDASHRKKDTLSSPPPSDRDRVRQIVPSKEPRTRNAALNRTSSASNQNTMVENENRISLTCPRRGNGRKGVSKYTENVVAEASSKAATFADTSEGRSTQDIAVHFAIENSSMTKTDPRGESVFDQDTCSRTPHAGPEVTELMPSGQRQKRIRHDVYTASDNKNDPITTIHHQHPSKRRKELNSSNPTNREIQNSSEVTLGFPREEELSEKMEIVPAEVAIPTTTTALHQIPAIPEPPIFDETDDEHDENELESRFGEIKDGYIWHSRCGWVIHPSYFEGEKFKLCVMHRACKHNVDCQTTRFQMAIISCARNKLTPREVQYLWGTSRTGVAKRASDFKGIPIRYLLIPVKRPEKQ